MSHQTLKEVLRKTDLMKHYKYLYQQGFHTYEALELLNIHDHFKHLNIPLGELTVIINAIKQTDNIVKLETIDIKKPISLLEVVNLCSPSPPPIPDPITHDPTRLCTNCVIGCTLTPSTDDPQIKTSVVLTTLMEFDERQVQCLDIDCGAPNPIYIRSWKDVYSIVAWDDPNYSPLRIGDPVFALFQNDDKTFTTVYYAAQISAMPDRNSDNHLRIDFVDEPDDSDAYLNISMPKSYTTNTSGGHVAVPTVIRKQCVFGTAVHRNAIQQLEQPSIDNNNHNNNGKDTPIKKEIDTSHHPRTYFHRNAKDNVDYKSDSSSAKSFIPPVNKQRTRSNIKDKPRPHKCQFCGKCFLWKGHLVSHERIHTGEKPHQCNRCRRRFTAKSTLMQHLNRKTKCKLCKV
eukprot:156805_1